VQSTVVRQTDDADRICVVWSTSKCMRVGLWSWSRSIFLWKTRTRLRAGHEVRSCAFLVDGGSLVLWSDEWPSGPPSHHTGHVPFESVAKIRLQDGWLQSMTLPAITQLRSKGRRGGFVPDFFLRDPTSGCSYAFWLGSATVWVFPHHHQ